MRAAIPNIIISGLFVPETILLSQYFVVHASKSVSSLPPSFSR